MLGLFLASCNTTKYVPQGEYLLASEELKVEGKGMKRDVFEPLVRQQPNRTIFGIFRLNLWFYNLSSDKDRRWDRWMRSVGEPPVILDSMSVISSARRMEYYAGQRGYYGSKVNDTIVYSKRKAYVSYDVQLAQPYRITSIDYDVMDKTLDASFIVDPKKRLIKVGNVFDGEVLKGESERIAVEMRERGYYQFYDSYIKYQADTTVGDRGVALKLLLLKEPTGVGSTTRNHRRFYVENLVVNPEYNPEKALSEPSYNTGWDTLNVQGFEMLCQECSEPGGQSYVKPELLTIANRIKTGELYNEQEVNRTYANFANFRLFKSINIRFSEPSADSVLPDSALHPLKGSIILSPFKRQSYTWGGEVSLSGNGLFGMALTGSYQHKNLFRGAEILDVSLTGAFQKVQVSADSAPENSYELGASVSLNIPKFLVPLNLSFYRNVFSPRTQIALSGDYQQRPDYTRALGALTFGYSWRNLGQMTYIYNPVDMNIINMLEITKDFYNSIKDNPYMLNSYQNSFLLGSTFSAIYNNRAVNRHRQYLIRGDVEFKGNLLWLGYKLADAPLIYDPTTKTKSYEVWGTKFAQFAKFDLTFTSLRAINASNSIALRALGGIGIAYGNLTSLPFDKMYYAGGANSLRGWQIRDVGPGAYPGDSVMSNRLADMRLEFNLEYRFNLFWKLEGALFLDAGNIWAINNEDSRSGAVFNFKTFPEQIAIDWGLGLRLNFTVLVIRLDYGMKIHDPAITNKYFVRPNDWFSQGYNSLFIALGYPF